MLDVNLTSVIRLKAKNRENVTQLARILPYIGQSRSGDDWKDAVQVGNAINALLNDPGLHTTWKEHNMGEEQIPKIAGLATKPEERKLFRQCCLAG